MVRPIPMDTDQIQQSLSALSGWSLREGKLHREYLFRNFVDAFGFMASCALVAERLDHHPEWSNVWNRVIVDLTTHDAGSVTELDFLLAGRMEEVARALSSNAH